MKRGHLIRASLALVTLSVQPLQVGFLSQFGQALAACVPTRTNHCAPPPDPGPPPPPAPPNTAIQYYLSPGFGGTPSSNSGSTDYFGGNSLSGYDFQNYLNSTTSSVPVVVNAPAADFLNTDIPTQARALVNSIGSNGTSAKSIVLVGHSTGVARIREALQHNGTYPNMGKVVGLISIGGANIGAPLAANAASLAGFLTGLYGSTLVYALPASVYGVIPAVLYARNFVDNLVGNPTAQDLRPGSTFLQNLNTPANGTIPASVQTLEIRGENNNLDAFIASGVSPFTTNGVTAGRAALGSTLAVFAYMAWAAAFWTFGATIPLALLLTASSLVTFALPTLWQQRGVGSPEGDSALTKSTQMIPAGMGGTPSTPVVLSTAVHVGDFGELNVRDRREYAESATLRRGIRAFQTGLALPQSPDPQ